MEMIRVLVKGETPAWRRLLAPVRYLSIKHDIKPRFDWIWPIILTIITVTVFWSLPIKPVFLGDDGFLSGVRDLIALFAAFFVVALAAVATFSRESLDKPMEGSSPQLNGRELSRREFVCYLFGYLAVLAFTLFLAIITAQILSPSLRSALSGDVLWWIKGVSGTVFAFGFWNMFVTTLLGIYFLVERVHIDKSDDGDGDQGRAKVRGRRAA